MKSLALSDAVPVELEHVVGLSSAFNSSLCYVNIGNKQPQQQRVLYSVGSLLVIRDMQDP